MVAGNQAAKGALIERAAILFTGIAIGAGLIAVPFLLPHLDRLLAAVFFYAGSVVGAVSLILLMIDRKRVD